MSFWGVLEGDGSGQSLDGDESSLWSWFWSVCSCTLLFCLLGASCRFCRSSLCRPGRSGLSEDRYSVCPDPFPGQDKQKMTPPASRKPAEMKVRHRAPPGWYLLLSGRSVVRKVLMTSLVYQDAGTRLRRLAKTKQPPAATAVCPLARRLPPQRVHLSPREARKSPKVASRQHRTMAALVVCRDAGRDRTEGLRVQLKTPELYHTQSIHRPCICEMGVMMLVHTLALTFQLGSSVATVAPRTPSSARTNARIWTEAGSMSQTPSLVWWGPASWLQRNPGLSSGERRRGGDAASVGAWRTHSWGSWWSDTSLSPGKAAETPPPPRHCADSKLSPAGSSASESWAETGSGPGSVETGTRCVG